MQQEVHVSSSGAVAREMRARHMKGYNAPNLSQGNLTKLPGAIKTQNTWAIRRTIYLGQSARISQVTPFTASLPKQPQWCHNHQFHNHHLHNHHLHNHHHPSRVYIVVIRVAEHAACVSTPCLSQQKRGYCTAMLTDNSLCARS